MSKAQSQKAVAVVSKAAPVTKAVVEKSVSKLEGLTKETVATKVITFKAGSGSADLLSLIASIGYDRVKVIEAAKKLKAAGKAFLKSDPEKKYNKVAGIVKRMTNAGFAMPKTVSAKG